MCGKIHATNSDVNLINLTYSMTFFTSKNDV
jgi:hypothetical protein